MKTKPVIPLIRKFSNGFLLLLMAIAIESGCKKSASADPCEGLLNEGTPTMVALLLTDARTGENLLLSRNIDTAAITISSVSADVHVTPGVIVKQPGSPLHGTLVFPIADTKKGIFKYNINIAQLGSVMLSYTNKEEKTTNACKPYYISVTEPAIEDHPFTIARSGSRLIVNVKF